MICRSTILLFIAYAAFVSLGLPDAVNGVAWPSIRDGFGLPQAGLGALVIASTVCYLCSGLLTSRMVGAVGVGVLLATSTALVTAGLIGFAGAPRWMVFLLCAGVVGFGSGAIDTALNHYAAQHFSMRHMNWLHGFYMVGAAMGPALMTAVLVRGASFRLGYAVLACALFALTLTFILTRRMWDRDGSSAAAPHSASPPVEVASTLATLRVPLVLLQAGVFYFACALEASVGQWCFTVLREHRGLSVAAAGQWTTAYWVVFAAGRFVLGAVAVRVGPVRMLRLCLLSAVGGALLFALAPSHAGAFGVVFMGIGLAPVYPTLMSHTPERMGPRFAPPTVGIQVAAASLSIATIPALAGILAGLFGLGAVGIVLVALGVGAVGAHEALLAALRRGGGGPPRVA